MSREYDKRVQQSFLFETQGSNVKLHNGGTLGLGTSRNVSSQRHLKLFIGMTRSLVSCCSHFLLWKNLRRILNCHLCQVRNIWTKHFYYFQGLTVLKCHRTKRLNRMNNQWKLPLQKTFSCSIPPPTWISRVFDPSSCENFQNPISRGGVDFFRNNPFI